MTDLDRRLIAAFRNGQSLDALLRELVVETNARAAGCWRLRDEHLELLGFGAATDMEEAVDHGFRAATQCVALDQIGLGIVQAAVSNGPAIGRRDPTDGHLDGSATWIARFEANTSLAVPIRCLPQREVVGVLAVSTAAIVDPRHPLWSRLHTLADQLGEPISSRAIL